MPSGKKLPQLHFKSRSSALDEAWGSQPWRRAFEQEEQFEPLAGFGVERELQYKSGYANKYASAFSIWVASRLSVASSKRSAA